MVFNTPAAACICIFIFPYKKQAGLLFPAYSADNTIRSFGISSAKIADLFQQYSVFLVDIVQKIRKVVL